MPTYLCFPVHTIRIQFQSIPNKSALVLLIQFRECSLRSVIQFLVLKLSFYVLELKSVILRERYSIK